RPLARSAPRWCASPRRTGTDRALPMAVRGAAERKTVVRERSWLCLKLSGSVCRTVELTAVLFVPVPSHGQSCSPPLPRARSVEYTMKALILYVILVTIGALVASVIGYYIEIEVSATASLIVFLALFFANFAVSWIAVIYIMDGSLKDADGRQ